MLFPVFAFPSICPISRESAYGGSISDPSRAYTGTFGGAPIDHLHKMGNTLEIANLVGGQMLRTQNPGYPQPGFSD